jgi:hypothetical protein
LARLSSLQGLVTPVSAGERRRRSRRSGAVGKHDDERAAV